MGTIGRRAPGRMMMGGAKAAPRVVIDEEGREVGVLLGHAEYVALLAHLAAHATDSGDVAERESAGREEGAVPVLPAYWRRALAAWIPGAAGSR